MQTANVYVYSKRNGWWNFISETFQLMAVSYLAIHYHCPRLNIGHGNARIHSRMSNLTGTAEQCALALHISYIFLFESQWSPQWRGQIVPLRLLFSLHFSFTFHSRFTNLCKNFWAREHITQTYYEFFQQGCIVSIQSKVVPLTNKWLTMIASKPTGCWGWADVI